MEHGGVERADFKRLEALSAIGIMKLHASGKENSNMAKAMTKSEVAAHMAEKVGISKKQASAFFDAQADLAHKQAKNTFVIPGIGKLVLSERAAREMVMRFGPKAGQTIKVPKKKVLKFRVAKAAKDAILGGKK
jgi:DNA-binding protein HU-beta